MLSAPERVDDIEMWGHELQSWSDATVPRGDASVALADLVLGEDLDSSARVLLVGPHDPRLLGLLAGRVAAVDVLVRSWPDAQDLVAARPSEHVRVHCGSWDRFDPGSTRWDAVLAPDGLSRLHGPESPAADWPDVLADLHAAAGEAGHLVVGVANDLAARLVWTTDAGADGRDDAWPLPVGARPVPRSAEEVVRWAGARGAATRSLALFPHLQHATVAVDDSALARLPGDERLRRRIGDSFVADGYVPLRMRDPRGVVDLVLDHDLGTSLAPGWFVVVGGRPDARERLYESEPSLGPHFGLCLVTDVDRGPWRRRLVGDGGERRSGPLRREPGRLARELADGPTLDGRLGAACAAHDLTAARAVVRRYASWLADRSEPATWTSPWGSEIERVDVVPGRLAFARLDNLREAADGALEVLDDSWDLEWPMPLDTVLLLTLARFADRLVTTGAAHPFAPGESPAGVARSLAAMSGRILRDRDVERAEALAGVIVAPHEHSTVVATDHPERSARTLRRPWGAADFHGLVELEQALADSAVALQDTREQVEWLLGRVVVENRRRKAMTIRAKDAESKLRLRSRLARRLAATGVADGVRAWRESRTTSRARWTPPTNDTFEAEVAEERLRMDHDRPRGT